jgi:c-di-GMP-binding flagellar brake protein YcgR
MAWREKMSLDYVKIGNKLNIVVENIDDELTSHIERMPKRDEFFISIPRHNGYPIKIPSDVDHVAIVYTEKSLYKFGLRAIENSKIDSLTQIAVKLLGEGERYQRRNFFRWTCHLPLVYKLIETEGEKVESESENFGIINDLSGSGMKFSSTHSMLPDSVVQCNITLEYEAVTVEGRLISAENTHDRGEFQYRMQFVNISDDDQQVIERYILRAQQKKQQL